MTIAPDALSGTVGRGGANARADVVRVQRMLNARRAAGEDRLDLDGIAGPLTMGAIERFQRRAMRMVRPDGLVEPGRRTWRALGGPGPATRRPPPRVPARAEAAASRAQSVAPLGERQLSGGPWWHRNQASYPNSRSLADLAPGFRENCLNFVAALRAAGATVRITTTRRSRERAYLMHYSWRLARGGIAAADVPAMAGVDIEWDHGDVDTSRAAAREMKRLFGMVHQAALNSNHIRGTAIDMTISRPASMSIVDGSGETVTVRTAGGLNTVGASYGVIKLVSDPPHWSSDGG